MSIQFKNREGVAEQLQPLLLALIDLSLILKQAHWNLRGERFRSVHLHLDEVLEDIRPASDEVAERIVTVGLPADGRVQTVARGTPHGEFPAGFLTIARTLELVVIAMEAAIATGRDAQQALADLDPVSEDLVIGVLATLEKHRWMLAAQLDHDAAGDPRR